VGLLAPPTQTWKSLFSKLDLEEFISEIDLNADFPRFYAKVHLAKSNVSDFVLSLKTVDQL